MILTLPNLVLKLIEIWNDNAQIFNEVNNNPSFPIWKADQESKTPRYLWNCQRAVRQNKEPGARLLQKGTLRTNHLQLGEDPEEQKGCCRDQQDGSYSGPTQRQGEASASQIGE